MKTIGLLGGMSWESTIVYYQILNEKVRERVNADHSAKCVLVSLNFNDLQHHGQQRDWKAVAKIIIPAAQQVERGGADFLLICTNTMHQLAEQVEAALSIPLLHIADVTGAAIGKQGMKKVGLLGTKHTMEEPFYKKRLQAKYGLDVVIPDEAARDVVHQVIYDELCMGKILPESRKKYQAIIADLQQQGAEGVILGCTEIPLLISSETSPIPVFDTTRIHAEAAVEFALA